MILNEFSRLKKGKTKTYVNIYECKCEICSKNFEVNKNKLIYELNTLNKDLSRYCSKECFYKRAKKKGCKAKSGCDNKHWANGYCRKHFTNVKKYGFEDRPLCNGVLTLPHLKNCKNKLYPEQSRKKNKFPDIISNNFCKTCQEREFRKFIIFKLGGKCNCCKEKTYEFLDIDHIDGGGGRHRKKTPRREILSYFYKNLNKNIDFFIFFKKHRIFCVLNI